MGGDMTGGVQRERGMIFLGEEAFWRRALDFWFGIFSGVGSLVLGVFVNHCRGHRVAGGFGHGSQDSLRYPGARESDRLLLAGWVVSRFWVEFSTVSASAWTNRDRGFSIRRRYFNLCICFMYLRNM
jgi:hypothetical protein